MAKETVQSVERAFQIIELMAKNETMGIREIHHETGLTGTVVHRIINTLAELGYVKQEKETEKYFLTYRLLVMGNYVQERNNAVSYTHLDVYKRQVRKQPLKQSMPAGSNPEM